MISRVSVVKVFVWLLSSAIFGLFINMSMQSGRRVIATWQQPAEIKYSSFDPYSLSVLAHGKVFEGFSFKDEYLIVIARRDGGPHGYGHRFKISVFPDGDEDAYIRRSAVVWSQEGVTFTEPTGHTVFFPAKRFTGGR